MEIEHIIATLHLIPMFSELREDELRDIAALCHVRECEKRTLLFQEGSPYRGFYVVLEGSVKVFKLSPDGRETVLHVLFPHQTLAEIPMFAGEDYPAHAECLARSCVMFIESDGFLSLLRRNPELSLRMLAGLSKRLRHLAGQLEDLTAHDVRTRLIHYLLDEYELQKPGRVLPRMTLRTSKSLLAAQIGTTLETLSRTFRKLEAEGLILMKGKSILLQDVERMEKEYGRITGQ
ncbi:MAG: Crp/Fnr family transcriptional regulator [Bacteroidetes bacterium]|nr:Crp/Fnr family transcriptional regulator [Bacteroidota bacterium]